MTKINEIVKIKLRVFVSRQIMRIWAQFILDFWT